MKNINTQEFIDRNKQIKKAGIAGFILCSLFAIAYLSSIIENNEATFTIGNIFGVLFWILIGVYCLYCRNLAAKTLIGDEYATKKMIYLLELETTIFAFIMLAFIAVKINKLFEKNENKELLKEIITKLKNKKTE